MLGLVLLGPFVERRWGSRAFFQFYIWAGLIAGVVTLVAAKLSPELFGTPVIGASGAVIAVVAAISFSYPKEQLGLFLVIPMEARWAVWLLAGLDTLFFFSNPHSDLAYQTHMGGILAGYLLVTGNWRPSKLSALFSGSKTPPRRSHLRVVPKDEDDEPPRYLH